MLWKWFAGRSVLRHIAVVVLVPAFLALAWWQLNRAESGNTLSWAYVIEWPLLAGYAVYMWWKLGREEHMTRAKAGPGLDDDDDATVIVSGRTDVPAGVQETDEDRELAAYNEYLAALSASDRSRRG